ncbi:hypothetical protein Agabi119p4_5908 [Agaricus bisporus var. burnettii]|uniref:Uncharacterized protein n=1 Tax=Agaricus bisporus var. burnettii TaxID=192524 RepID=A0A8H7F0Y2_AGABI|nr:hypothetical protein Agabi119p4_5908 [Agaricus bisporus var. burnettii]
MPTTTATVTHSTHVSLKAMVIPPGAHKPSTLPSLQPPPMSSGTTATMRPLYNRATRAFLHRDTRLTYTLLEAAFANLHPPLTSVCDSFADDRRKWDILRITLESTVYASNPSQTEQSALPDPLRSSLSETPHVLISNLYNRSLSLFTPTDSVISSPSPAYLPSQVLATLVLASLKVECPDFGRVMIEDWLARRDPAIMAMDGESEHESGYSKILDLYCLHVLPKLQQWEYALEFLEYESELSSKTRDHLKSRLSILQARSSDAASQSAVPDGFGSSTPRPHSPAPSTSSSSSLSTASTHTVVPSNRPNGLAGIRSRSRSSSDSSKSDATARAVSRSHRPHLSTFQNGHARPSISRSRKSRTASSSSTSRTQSSVHPRVSPVAQSTAVTRLSTYSLVKAAIQPYLKTSRIATVFLIFVVLPLVSFLVRRRRRAMTSRGTSAGSAAVTNAELVRRRLGGMEAGLLGRFWGEVLRAVTDTVKMAGSGLV